MNYYPPQAGDVGRTGRYGFTQGQYGGWTRPAAGQPTMPAQQTKLKAPPVGTTERVPYLYPPGSVQAFFGRNALLFGTLMTVIAFLLFLAIGALTPLYGIEGEILVRLLICTIIVGICWMMGMSGELRPTRVGIKTSMTLGLYPILTSLFVGTVLQGWGPSTYVMALLSPGGLLTAISILILCLLIGGFEEMLTRGIFLSALQSRLGKSSRGLFVAAYGSAILFGMLHVISPLAAVIMGKLPLTGSILAQMILKTIQTGMLGVLLAAITIRTHSIWGAVIIHALDDFCLMLPGYLSGAFSVIGMARGSISPVSLLAESELGEYVTDDPSKALVLIVLYIIISIVYLPYLFTAGRLIRAARIPDTGAMCEEYVAHEIEEYNRKSLVLMYPLVPLVPQWQAPAPMQMAVPYQMSQVPAWASPSMPSPTLSQVSWQTMPQPTWGQQGQGQGAFRQQTAMPGYPQRQPYPQTGQQYPQANQTGWHGRPPYPQQPNQQWGNGQQGGMGWPSQPYQMPGPQTGGQPQQTPRQPSGHGQWPPPPTWGQR